MKLGLVAASLFVAGSAFAQAPGEVGDSQDVQAPGMTPADSQDVQAPGMAPVVPAPPPAPPPPRDRHWSVGLGIGGLNLTPHHSETETSFSIGMLAVRWRPCRHLELEFAVSGGSEKDASDTNARDVQESVLALRWRFNPQRKWNLWAMAGMGTLTVSPQDASKEQLDALHQSTLQFGGGLERRWSRFALQAELRIVGVAPVDGAKDEPPMAGGGVTSTTTGTSQPPPPTTTMSADGWKGSQLVISGNYYF